MGSGPIKLTGAYYSGVGNGPAYEDDLFFSHVLSGGNVRAVAAVADGMGEGLGGLRAAQAATGMIKSLLLARIYGLRGRTLSELELSELLKEAMQKANAQLLRMAGKAPLGATLTAMVFTDEFAVLGHVGDCRAYRLQEGRLKQLTEDHAVGIALTRRLGKEPGMQMDLSVEPVREGQIFVLCSNGLHSRVGDAEIAENLERCQALNQACVDMVNLAMERGGAEADCASAIVVECGEYPRKPASDPLPTQEPQRAAQAGALQEPLPLDQPLPARERPTPRPLLKRKTKQAKLKTKADKPKRQAPKLKLPKIGRKQALAIGSGIVGLLLLIWIIGAIISGLQGPETAVSLDSGPGVLSKLLVSLIGLAIPAGGIWWWQKIGTSDELRRAFERFK